MAFILIAVTALFFVVLPLALLVFCLTSLPVARSPEDVETQPPTTNLGVGRQRVLEALHNSDLGGAERAFLEMVDGCGTCGKLHRPARGELSKNSCRLCTAGSAS